MFVNCLHGLGRRLAQHYDNRGTAQIFAGRYFCYHLLYAEQFAGITSAIAREKELKGWTRAKKETLIAAVNPEWEFLPV